MKCSFRQCAAAWILAAVVAAPAAVAGEPAQQQFPQDMLQAGATALMRELPRGAAELTEADASELARLVFAEMYEHQWQPIETAPLDQEILLGLDQPDGFRQALGHWEVHDEVPFDGGRWTVAEWWKANPTHWMPIPPLPAAK